MFGTQIEQITSCANVKVQQKLRISFIILNTSHAVFIFDNNNNSAQV